MPVPNTNILRKAKNAYAEARRVNPALPKAIPGLGKVATHKGYQIAAFPIADGTTVTYAVIPSYRMMRISEATPKVQMPATPRERFRRAADIMIAELALVERTVNGAGNGAAHHIA
jgi:hypothetical protein